MAKVIGYALVLAGSYFQNPWLIAAGNALLIGDSYEQGKRAKRRALAQYNASLQDRMEMVDVTPDAARTLVMGRVRAVEGVRRKWVSGTNSERLTMVVSFAGHEIDAFEQFYFNDVPLTLDGSGYVLTAPFNKGSVSTSVRSLTLDGSGGGTVALGESPIAGSLSAVWRLSGGDGGGSDICTASLGAGNIVTVSGGNPGAQCTVSYQVGVSSPTARIRAWTGAAGQNVGAAIVADYPGKITSSDKFAGMAVAVVDIDYDPDIYVQGRPNVTAVMRGARLLDPRTGTTAWSENPALQAYHYARHANGWAVPVEDIRTADVVAAANACDVSTTFPLRTVGGADVPVNLPRYRSGTVIVLDSDPRAAMDEIFESMAGRWGWAGGQLRLRAGVLASTVDNVTPSWLALRVGADGTVQTDPLVKISNGTPREQRINRVTGRCVNPAERWQVLPFPAVEDATLIAAKGVAALEVDFGAVNHIAHAQHLGTVAIREAQASMRMELSCNIFAWRAELFDVMALQLPRYGMAGNTAEVTGWRWHPTEGVTLKLAEISADLFTVVTQLTGQDPAPNSSLPSPWQVEQITGLAVTSGTDALTDGSVLTRTQVTWNPVVGQSVRSNGRVQVQYILAAPTLPAEWPVWDEAGSAIEATIPALQAGEVYLFRARAIGSPPLGVRGGWSLQVAHRVAAVPPALVTGRLTKPSVTYAATSAGVVASFTPGSGTFEVYDAGVRKTSGVTYSVPSSTGITIAIDSAGDYTVSAMAADTATATLRAVYAGTTINLGYSASKARAGAAGAEGATGATGAAGAAGAPGATGAAGAAGASGTQAAVVYLYQWATTAPGSPTGTSTFTWATAVNGSYSGGAGWAVGVPANPGTTGIKLWVATKQVSAIATATSTVVDWTTGVTVAAWTSNGNDGAPGAAGAAGAAGVQSAIPTVYQWAVTLPAGPTGAPTYTWATGDFGAAPSGWTLTPGTSPSAGFTLWGAAVNVTDAATSTTTGFNWSSASITARGYAGSDGSAGAAAKAIDLAASSQVFQIPKTGSVTPASITFTATGQNLAGSPSFSVVAGTATLAGSGSTRTLAYADLASETATVQVTQDGLTDTITVVKVREGADTYNIILSNQAHTLPAGPTGGATSYAGAETYLTILQGAVDDTANWTVSYSDNSLDSIRSTTQGGTASGTGRWWRVVNLPSDLGTVVITATKGGLTLSAVFSCQLARSGATGSTGNAGASSRMCYARVPGNPSPTSGFVTTSGSSSFPAAGASNTTWGINLAWTGSDPNPSSTDTLYQADGIFDPATGNTVWATPYISSLKVGTLSAITVNTGALTVQDLVTIGTTGAIRGGSNGYLGGTVFMGYDAGAYKISAGNSTLGFGWSGSALNVYGGTITGGLIRTAATGSRVEINEGGNNLLEIYNNPGSGLERICQIGSSVATGGGAGTAETSAKFGSLTSGNARRGVHGESNVESGVVGVSVSNSGARGVSSSGAGVEGSSSSGPGVYGASSSGPGGHFVKALTVAGTGASADPYGALSVTMPSGSDYSYIGLTRAGSSIFCMGIDTSNLFWLGAAGAGYAGTRSGTPAMLMNLGGSVQFAGQFGCNGNGAQGKYTVNGACFDEASAVALLNQIRTALINNGICQ